MSYKKTNELYKKLQEGFIKVEGLLRGSEKVKRTLSIPNFVDDLLLTVLGRLMMLGKKVNYSDLISVLAYYGLKEISGNMFEEVQDEATLASLFRKFGESLGKSFETAR